MKIKNLLMIMAVSSLMMSTNSCNSGKSTKTSNATEEEIDEAKAEKAQTNEEDITVDAQEEAAIKAFITNMYENHLFEDYDFLEAHCSKQLLQYLRDEFEYDGDGYAVWLFRTGTQDGKPGAMDMKDQVLSITTDNDGWFHYTFTDCGWRGENKLRAHMENGQVVMDAIEHLYDECSAEHDDD